MTRVSWDLCIAGLRVRLRLSAAERDALLEQYAGFVSAEAAAITFDVVREPGMVADDVLFCPPAGRVLPDGLVLHQGDPGRELFALEVRGDQGTLRYRESGPDRAGFGPSGIRGALAAWIACALVEHNGLLLHGAGVLARGRAVLALGPSGAGKSTFSAMFPSHVIFNDELVAVTEGPSARSTPFSGTVADPRLQLAAPLGGLLILQQGPHTNLEAVTTAEMAATVMKCVALPVGLPHLERRAFALALGGVAQAARGRLVFTKNAEAVRAAIDAWPALSSAP